MNRDDDRKVVAILKERLGQFVLGGMDGIYCSAQVPYQFPFGAGASDARMRSLRLIKEAAEEMIEDEHLKKLS